MKLRSNHMRTNLGLLSAVAFCSFAANDAFAIPAPPGSPESICGATTDWQEVEQYDGTLGVHDLSIEFVDRQERPVGNLKWKPSWRSSYTNPGNIPDNKRWCTGTLISNDLFITASHCLKSADDPAGWVWPKTSAGVLVTPSQAVANMEVSFNYQLDSSNNPRTETKYNIVSVEEFALGGLDYAILKLSGSPGQTWGYTPVAPVDLTVGDELTIIQHPAGVPKKIHSGSYWGMDGSKFGYDNIDTEGGSSGSGVLDWQGRLVGVHVSGGCQEGTVNHAVPMTSIAAVSPLVAQNLREVGQYSVNVVSGDFNGDGKADVVVGAPGYSLTSKPAAGAVRVLYGSASGLGTTATVIHQDTSSVAGSAEAGDFCGAAVVSGKFNNDNFDDVAFGCPGEAVGSVQDAGAVVILYGSASGLTGTGSFLIDQDASGMAGTAAAGNWFGSALTSGDLDNNGIADLAIGSPGETVGGLAHAGAVSIVYGQTGGLSTTNSQNWTQDSSGIGGVANAGDRFGASLTSGDFDADGVKDLAIGIPSEDIGSAVDTGAVQIIYGTASTGLTSTDSQVIDQGTTGVPGDPETGDRMGAALRAGDFDNDGASDLAIGNPGEAVSSYSHAGSVVVLYGASSTGINPSDSVALHQDSTSVPGAAEYEDRFGLSLGASKLDSGSFVDLVVGAPGEAIGSLHNAGYVVAFYGSSSALSGTGSVSFDQDVTNIEDVVEQQDRFGACLATGDIKADGVRDLLLSVPGEFTSAGAAAQHSLAVIPGVAAGLTATGDQFIQ